MISCWWRDCGWLRHCSLWSLMCVCGGVFIYLFVCVFVHMCELRWWSYIAHVDNLGSLLHPLHLRWRRQGMENRGRERELKVWSDFWGTLLVIHAVTHEANHSLCSCAGHMFNMISQHLPCPWKFLLLFFFFHGAFSPPSLLSVCWRCCPDTEAGACLSHSSLPRMAPYFTQAWVS